MRHSINENKDDMYAQIKGTYRLLSEPFLNHFVDKFAL